MEAVAGGSGTIGDYTVAKIAKTNLLGTFEVVVSSARFLGASYRHLIVELLGLEEVAAAVGQVVPKVVVRVEAAATGAAAGSEPATPTTNCLPRHQLYSTNYP